MCWGQGVRVFVLMAVLLSPLSTRAESDGDWREGVDRLLRAEHAIETLVREDRPDRLEDGFPGRYFLGSLTSLRAVPAGGEVEAWIIEHARDLPAPFLLELASRRLGHSPQEAMKWYGVYRIRASYDAERCKDPEAAVTIVRVAIRFRQVFDYAKRYPGRYRAALPDAIRTASEQGYWASPLWLCGWSYRPGEVHEAEAVAVHDLLAPPSEWPLIWEGRLQKTQAAIRAEDQQAAPGAVLDSRDAAIRDREATSPSAYSDRSESSSSTGEDTGFAVP